jgi:hypothetical protein
MRLLEHLQSVEVLDQSSAAEWLQLTMPNRRLLVGLEHRCDERLDWLLRMSLKPIASGSRKKGSSKPSAKVASREPARSTAAESLVDWSRQHHVACVLGEHWSGHRRSYPLPESIETFYWHQWYDQVIPWVCHEACVLGSGVSSLRVGRIQADVDRFVAWRSSQSVQDHLSNRIAWCVSDNDSSVQMWQGLLEGYGIRTVGSRIDQLHGKFQADLLIIDYSAREGIGSNRSLDAWLLELRAKQPDAFFVVIDPFVEMERWANLRSLGADAIVGKPCSPQGFLFSWHQWLKSC